MSSGPRRRHLPLLLLSMLLTGLHPSGAAAIRVLSVNQVQPALAELAQKFKSTTGHEVTIDVPRAADLTRILGSDEPADVLIGTTATVDQAIKDGQAAGLKTQIARVGIGVMVRRGAAVPNVANTAA